MQHEKNTSQPPSNDLRSRPSPSETRRGFLKKALAAGAASLAPGAVQHGGTAVGGVILTKQIQAKPTAHDSDGAEHQWCMVFDLRRCDGCEKCLEACQKTHYLSDDQEWIKVYERRNASGETYFMPRLCMHCANPPCVRVCPVGATFRDEEGVVLVDQNVCIGCRTCMAACPYEARYFNWSEPPPAPTTLQQTMPEFPVPQQKGTVGKCILCVHNTDVGKLPACVEACTMEAIYIGDLEADLATNGTHTVKLSRFLRENDAIRYKEELGTEPRVYYILGHGQDLEY